MNSRGRNNKILGSNINTYITKYIDGKEYKINKKNIYFFL